MTIDEAIKHAEEVAEENETVANTRTFKDGYTVDEMYCDDTECINEHLARCAKCGEEHRQLAEWLKELKQLREQQSSEDSVSRKYEKFESVKDHICKLASDYKCWDNRLTSDEALELCHILEKEPCEDAVSRQAMLEYQQYLHGKMPNEENYKLWKFITDLPPITPTTRWIPVSERLPEEDQVVLGTDSYDCLYTTYTWDDCGEIKWYADGNYDVPIVAWIPLPKKYKAGEE